MEILGYRRGDKKVTEEMTGVVKEEVTGEVIGKVGIELGFSGTLLQK